MKRQILRRTDSDNPTPALGILSAPKESAGHPSTPECAEKVRPRTCVRLPGQPRESGGQSGRLVFVCLLPGRWVRCTGAMLGCLGLFLLNAVSGSAAC